MPRPSAIPPAATVGVGETASTPAGTRGRVATVPQIWPPASHPWATTASIPASTARFASPTLAIVCSTVAPAAWAAFGVPVWRAPEERDDPHVLLEAVGQPGVLGPREPQVHPEGAVGPFPGLPDHRADLIRIAPAQSQHPQPRPHS